MSKEEGRGWNGRVEKEEVERGWKLIGILRLGEQNKKILSTVMFGLDPDIQTLIRVRVC